MKDAKAPTSVDLATSSTLIVAANPNRTGLYISRLTATGTIFLAFGFPAELNKGITLRNNDAFAMTESSFSTDAVYAIASNAGQSVAVQEFELA